MTKPFALKLKVEVTALYAMTPTDVWFYAERHAVLELGKRPSFLRVLIPDPERILPIVPN